MEKKRLIKLLEEKAGFGITTPHGADRLQKEIESATGERLSVNTVKRLTGVLPYDGSLRISTLDIIARYLGYTGAQDLLKLTGGNTSDFNLPSAFVDLSQQAPDVMVVLEWSPGRRITLQHLGSGRYSLIESLNSKLQAADIVELGVVGEGMALLVKNVIRGDKDLGPYTAAPESGLTAVRIVDKDEQ